MVLAIILLSVILCFSALFSGSETAVFSMNSGKVESLKYDSLQFYNKVKRFTDFPYRFLLFILLSNMVVNVGFTSSAEKFFNLYLPLSKTGFKAEIVVFVLITVVLLIFGEIVPKSVAINYPVKFLKVSNTILTPLSFFLFPVLKFFGFLETFFNNIKTIVKPYSLERGSLEAFAEVVSHNTKIDARQKLFLKIAYGLDSIFNVSVMRAITDMPTQLNIENIKRVNSGEIPFIVVSNPKTNEPSTIFTSKTDLRKKEKEDDEFVVVASCHSVYSTLKKMLQLNKEYAIIIDEYGLWKGYIEYNHIFELISRDAGVKAKINPGKKSAVFDASVTLAEITMDYGYKFTQGNYTTLNGYIISKLGLIPQAGYDFESDGLKLKVIESTKTKTKKIKIVNIQ